MSPAPAAADTAPSAAAAAAGWRYGLLGLPLALASLPLYVHLPHHWATVHGLPLATLGTLLLASRAADALVDPWLGRWVDRLQRRGGTGLLALGAAAAGLLALGLFALFVPPLAWLPPDALLAWVGGWLALTCGAASALGIAHQAWGTALGGTALQRGRVVAWREGLGLLGVLLATTLPVLLGLAALPLLAALGLGLGWLAWAASPRPAPGSSAEAAADWRRPWRQRGFRRLLAVFALNGLASAVPATLVLFFIADRLAAPAPWPALLLGLYFGAAALALPLWLRAVARWGLARSWLAGMTLAITAFAGTATLGAGDAPLFALVCLGAGAALGADLALPGAMLAGVIARAGDRGRHDGSYLGWWQVLTKLNLALAAGAVLPLLDLLGYRPGTEDPAGLARLTWAYAGLPCALKALAAALLWRHFIRQQETPA